MVYSTLVGMAIHKGNHSQKSGHYTALVKHENSYQIINDDTIVHSRTKQHVITADSIQSKSSTFNAKSNFCVYE